MGKYIGNNFIDAKHTYGNIFFKTRICCIISVFFMSFLILLICFTYGEVDNVFLLLTQVKKLKINSDFELTVNF